MVEDAGEVPVSVAVLVLGGRSGGKLIVFARSTRSRQGAGSTTPTEDVLASWVHPRDLAALPARYMHQLET